MKAMGFVAVVFVAVLAIGCVKGAETGSSMGPPESRAVKRGESADSTPGADRRSAGRDQSRDSAAKGKDVCALISPKEIETITGLPIERTAPMPNGCEWYANPEAQRQRGVDTARKTFEKLNTHEPASASDAAQSMQSLLRGVSGAVAPNKALFGVSVQWENGDQAETLIKGTVAMSGGGQSGGGLERVDGVGDRAFMGAMGAIFYARKGPAFIQFGVGLGNRDQAIALARLVVARI
jgi:hypothetical protein